MKLLKKFSKYTKDTNTRGIIELNLLTGILFFIVNSIASFFVNPFLLNNLGSSNFGLWKSINLYMGFASFADGRGAQALKWTIANRESVEDFSNKRRDIACALIVCLLMLPFTIIIICALTYYFPSLINNIYEVELYLLRIIVFCMGINLILSSLSSIPEAILIGTNRNYYSNLIKIFWHLIYVLLLFIILELNYSLFGLTIITIATTISKGIHNIYLVKRKIKWLGLERPSKQEIYFFLNFSSLKLLWTIIARFLMSCEVLIIGYFFSTMLVSNYVFSSFVALIGLNISGIITSSVTPTLGKIKGSHEIGKLEDSIKILREIVFAYSIFMIAIFLMLNHSFVSLWVGSGQYLGFEINVLISLSTLLLIHIRTEAMLIDLSLDIKKKVIVGLAAILITLITTYLGLNYLYNSLWIIFVCIIFGRLMISLIFPYYTNSLFSKKPKYNLFQLKHFFALMIVFVSIILGYYQNFETWFHFIIIFILESLITAFLVFNFLLKVESKNIIFSKIFK